MMDLLNNLIELTLRNTIVENSNASLESGPKMFIMMESQITLDSGYKSLFMKGQ